MGKINVDLSCKSIEIHFFTSGDNIKKGPWKLNDPKIGWKA